MPERQIGAAFDDGAAEFELLAPSLWNPMGNALAAAAGISVGDRILDACCGSGATTIPAAQYAGPAGHVDGVDLAAGLLALAQGKADTLSMENVSLHHADVISWTSPEPYDVALCAYGVFFLPAMDADTAHILSTLRSGGRFALSTWASGALLPFSELFRQECLREDPTLADRMPSGSRNAERIDTPEKLTSWLEGLGLEQVKVSPTPAQVQLVPSLAWSLVAGSPLRTLLPADAAAAARVKERFLAGLGDEYMLNADTLIATAVKP